MSLVLFNSIQVLLLASAILNANACCELKESNGVVKCLPSTCKGNSTLDLKLTCTKTVKSIDLSNLEIVHNVNLGGCPHADWSKLQNISNIMYIHTLYGSSVTFPALKHCEFCTLELQNATEVALPVLEHVHNFDLQVCENVKAFTLPSLKKISGNFNIRSNDKLETVSLPVLVSGYWLSTANNNELTSFNAPMLKTISFLDFAHNHVLPKVVFPKLEFAHEIQFADNPHLTELSFPALPISTVVIDANSKLTKIHLPKLHQSDSILINRTADNLCVDLACFERAPKHFDVIINGTKRNPPVCNATVWKYGCGK